MRLIPTEHFRKKMNDCGFITDQIIEAFRNPRVVTDVACRPEYVERGQKRVCGAGVAIIIEPCKEGWILKTVYADMIRTPLREDQKNDEYALRSTRLRG